jgi:hypothetical protein
MLSTNKFFSYILFSSWYWKYFRENCWSLDMCDAVHSVYKKRLDTLQEPVLTHFRSQFGHISGASFDTLQKPVLTQFRSQFWHTSGASFDTLQEPVWTHFRSQFWHTSGASFDTLQEPDLTHFRRQFLKTKTWKKKSYPVTEQFSRHNPKSCWPQSFRFLFVWSPKKTIYSAPIDNRHFISALFIPV